MRPSRLLREIALRLGLVLFGLGLVFVFCEVGLRARDALRQRAALNAAPEADDLWAVYDPLLGYRLNPAYGDINPDGLRDDPLRPKDDRFRILILGDSVGYYGDDAHDTYVGHLEARLNPGPGAPEIDVVNASVKGYTTYQELQYLKHYGLALQPDLVGVGFVLNDLHRFLHSFAVKDGKIVQYQMYAFTDEALGSVDGRPRSAFLDWLAYKLKLSYATARSRMKTGYAFDYRVDFSTAWKDESWATIRGYFEEFRELSNSEGFDLFVVIFPFGQQYDPTYLSRDREYVLKPQRLLRSICAELEIACLDLYDLLDPEQHLSEDEIHLTGEGRAEVARQVASFLRREGLIPMERLPVALPEARHEARQQDRPGHG